MDVKKLGLFLFLTVFSQNVFGAEANAGIENGIDISSGIELLALDKVPDEALSIRGETFKGEALKRKLKNLKESTDHGSEYKEECADSDYLIDLEKLHYSLAQLDKDYKIKPQDLRFLIKIRDSFLAARLYSVSSEVENMLPSHKEAAVVVIDVWAVAAQSGINFLEEGNEPVLIKLFSVDHKMNAFEQWIKKADVWKLDPDNPEVKKHLDFFKQEIESGEPRLASFYRSIHTVEANRLYQAIDEAFFDSGFTPTMQEDLDMCSNKVIQTLLKHGIVVQRHSMVKTREDLLRCEPWIENFYSSLYGWFSRNKTGFLNLVGNKSKKRFKMAPSFFELNLPVLEEKKEKPLIKKEKPLTKKQKELKAQEDEEELARVLSFLGEETSSKSLQKKKPKKPKKSSKEKKFESSVAKQATSIDAVHDLAASQGAQAESKKRKKKEQQLFAEHYRSPIVYDRRITDWFKSPESAMQKQGYMQENSFRERLVRHYGKQKIIENHRFPKVVDAHLLNSGATTIVQQQDGTFKMALPGYRKVITENGPVKEFGIFEVAYRVNTKGGRHVYHRFFRPVKDHTELVNDFNLSQDESHLINAYEGESVHSDESWTTAAEQEGWGLSEDTPGLVRITHPVDKTSYGLISVH